MASCPCGTRDKVHMAAGARAAPGTSHIDIASQAGLASTTSVSRCSCVEISGALAELKKMVCGALLAFGMGGPRGQAGVTLSRVPYAKHLMCFLVLRRTVEQESSHMRRPAPAAQLSCKNCRGVKSEVSGVLYREIQKSGKFITYLR